MEEQVLAERCRQGDNLARKELYERYAGRMLSVCLRYAGDRDTAEDLMHDGFLKLFDSFDKFTWRGDGSLRAWMERPLLSPAQITRRLTAVEELVKKTIDREELLLSLAATPLAHISFYKVFRLTRSA